MRKRTFIVVLIVFIIIAGIIAWYFLQSLPHSVPQQSGQTSNSPTQTALVCTETLPIEVQIGQKLMFAGYNAQLEDEATIFQEAFIGGVIVMDEIPKAKIADFTKGFNITPTVAVDQEGGTVQRYITEGALLGASDITSISTQNAYNTYLADDKYLKDKGITTNFAPVVDVMSANPNPLPGRIYSNDPAIVTAYARQAIQASKDVGITPVIKHFPGLGSANGNTDNGSATTDSLDELKKRDLIPYRYLASTQPDVMINNAIVPGLTDGQPAVWSPATISLLKTYGYDQSVIYSDSLTARALPGTFDDATLKAWQAGIDVSLVVQKQQETNRLNSDIAAIVDKAKAALNSGGLDKKAFANSVLRILRRKQIDPCKLAQNLTH